MHRIVRKPRLVAASLAATVIVAGLGAASTASGSHESSYTVHNLVSDQAGKADFTDPNLVNAWGIAASSASPWWVADNGMDVSTLYNGAGVAQPQPTPLVVKVDGGPTGVVNNSATGFVVSDGNGHSGPSVFMFASEDGKIRGWNPNVPPPVPPATRSTQSFVVVDKSGEGAIFKGLAISGNRIFAADFHNAKVDVFDSGFTQIPGGFVDPKLPKGYAPFGIQAIGGNIFVSYAKQDATAEDEVDGQGRGIVDEYSTDGALITRVAQHGHLNAPWGMAVAPASGFGEASGDLLVGNFGDGKINVFAPKKNGKFEAEGQLRGGHGRISIDGLWGIGFGNGSGSGSVDDLYFAAGPDGEMHGLFGVISVAQDDGDD